MKQIICILLLLASTSAYAQGTVTNKAQNETMAELKAKIDSIRASANRKGSDVTKAYADSIVSADSFTTIFASNNVKVVEDTNDAMWVQVDVPLLEATKFEKQFWLSWIADAKKQFYGQPGIDSSLKAVPGRIRVSKAHIKNLLTDLNDKLK